MDMGSKARNFYIRSNTGIVVSNPTQGMDATAILATRSCCVSTGVSYTRLCMYPQRKKSNGVKSGERGGQVIGSSMVAPQHNALMSSLSIWMKPLATD
jgi:hypothetical protein